MTRYHVVLAHRIDVEKTRRGIAERSCPRHFMLAVADALGATIWEPPVEAMTPRNRTLSDHIAIIAPEAAAFAESVVDAVGENDVIFCNSEGASIPIADRMLLAGKKTPLTALGHNLWRPRMHLLRKLTPVFRRHDKIFVVSAPLAERLASTSELKNRVSFISEQTDDQFYGAVTQKRQDKRPLIMSVGLEQRDYTTLAKAVEDLPVDVAISAFSKDTLNASRAMPETLPANMTCRFYEWDELAQLYADADLVVAPVFENDYAAGITTILEGMASGKPVIASRTKGLSGVFEKGAPIVWAPPEDAAAMRSQISHLLDNREKRNELGAQGKSLIERSHTMNGKAEELASQIKSLAH